jgi:outer membrane protein insertion porin family
MLKCIQALALAAAFALTVGSTVAGAQIVGEIVVEGNEHISRDRVLLGLGVVIGEELSPEAVREGVRKLYEMGHFSDVQVYADELPEDTLRLIVTVAERPRISDIRISGNDKVSDSDIEDVLRIETDTPFDSSRLEDSRVSILELYESKGFPNADVQLTAEETSATTLRVQIDINEKTRVTVAKIRFEGVESVEKADLKSVLKTKEDRWWRTNAFFDRGVLDEDLVRVVDRYREEGYIDARAPGYETEYDETGEKVTVTILVEEGGLYRVSGIDWVGASDFAVEPLHELTTVTAGDVYRPAEADVTIREAYSWYGERGYIHARIFRMEDVESGNEVRLKFYVDEAKPARIGQIHIVGNSRTKEKVIRRELAVKPGDLYQTSEVIASQRKVANLGFFNGPAVDFAESTNPDNIDLVFTVEERQTGKAGVGISHTSEKGITGFLELTEGNLFGDGRYLDLKWEFGKNNTELVLGFTEPWFMDRQLSVGFDIYDTDDKRTYSSLPDSFYQDAFPDDVYDEIAGCSDCSRQYVVERERRGGDVRVGWPFLGSRNTMLYTKYTLEQFNLSEYANVLGFTEVVEADTTTTTVTVDERYDLHNPGWEWRSGLTATLVRRTTDRRFHPRLGSYSRFTADLFGGALGGDVEYQRYVLDARKYIPAIWISTLMLRARTGIVTGYGDPSTVPDDTRFELGGVGLNGLRGYANRSILPRGSDLYGGRTMLLGSAELKFPITNEREQLPVYGLAFIDVGNTWETAEDIDPGDMYWGAGVGVRLEVPVLGNLGIDLGYGFDEDEGQDWRVHYQFGVDF